MGLFDWAARHVDPHHLESLRHTASRGGHRSAASRHHPRRPQTPQLHSAKPMLRQHDLPPLRLTGKAVVAGTAASPGVLKLEILTAQLARPSDGHIVSLNLTISHSRTVKLLPWHGPKRRRPAEPPRVDGAANTKNSEQPYSPRLTASRAADADCPCSQARPCIWITTTTAQAGSGSATQHATCVPPPAKHDRSSSTASEPSQYTAGSRFCSGHRDDQHLMLVRTHLIPIAIAAGLFDGAIK
jgi:hypothetical protein